MVRNGLVGALAFGATGTAAAYVWTGFEFPFAIVLPAFVGWYAVVRTQFGSRKALTGGLVGGVSFTAVFMLALLFALTDGSPVALSAWLSAVISAAVAGALTGSVLGGVRPALALAGFSAVGMLVAVAAASVLRSVAPGSVDVEGPVQYAYFALSMGVVATIVGAAAGAGVAWVRAHA